jgi:hypothetical protein
MGNLATVPISYFVHVNKDNDNLSGDYERNSRTYNVLDFALKLESSLYSPLEAPKSEQTDIEWLSEACQLYL